MLFFKDVKKILENKPSLTMFCLTLDGGGLLILLYDGGVVAWGMTEIVGLVGA